VYFYKLTTTTLTPPNFADVIVSQKNTSQQDFGNFGRWRGTNFVSYASPQTFVLQQNSSEVFRADQTVQYLNPTQKYDLWETYTSVVNPQPFTIIQNQPPITASFAPTNDATLQSILTDNGSNIGAPKFQDPWFLDATDTNHGNSPINEGTSAPFDPVTYSQNDIGINSGHQGVFLSLDPTQGAVNYYSVRAPITQTVGGYTAIFTGWSATNATFQQVGTNPPGYDQKAVVITGSGATITANYSRTTVSSNVTLPAGSYSFMGTLTVNSGATLTLSSSTTLNFPSHAVLVVNGALVSSGTTFNFVQSPSYPYLTGITINSNGSSLTNCTISGADQPLAFNNVNTATIRGGTINNSTFSSSQAISVSNSTPTIQGININGQSGSSNGVRYTNGGGGTLDGATIQSCGVGNGIVIQGNSSPTITGGAITNNYYYGIIVTGNGTAIPLIKGNQFSGNGTHGSTRQYHNLVFLSTSHGTVQSNTMTGSIAGIGVYGGSFPTAGVAQNGSNTITGNNYGLMCSDNGSGIYFGYFAGQGQYNGTCNNIDGNTSADGYASGGGIIIAEYNWWGRYPPSTSQFVIGSGSTIDYNNALTSQPPGGCPSGGGGNVIIQGNSSLTTGVDTMGLVSELYQRATVALFSADYISSSSLCRLILRSNASVTEKQRALVRLLSVFLQDGDTTIVSDLKSYMVGSDSLSQTAEEQLANAYAASGNTSKAVSLANDLITKNPGTETEKRALLFLASLRAYDKNAESISAQSLKDVKARFGSSLDQGLMAALTTANDVPAVGFSSNREAAQKAKGEVKVDNTNTAVTEYGIENYPNPFNPATTIAYQLPKDGKVTIKIFDAIGREVTTLVDEFKPSGRYSVQFDASHLSSGIYFYSLRSGSFNVVKKMSLIK
jgi:Secretion system C-terminal sorting domain